MGHVAGAIVMVVFFIPLCAIAYQFCLHNMPQSKTKKLKKKKQKNKKDNPASFLSNFEDTMFSISGRESLMLSKISLSTNLIDDNEEDDDESYQSEFPSRQDEKNLSTFKNAIAVLLVTCSFITFNL